MGKTKGAEKIGNKIKKHVENKIQKNIIKSLLKITAFTSILVILIALALSSYAATVRVQDGNFNVSNNLLVNTNTLFVDSANNRVGIGTDTPLQDLHIRGGSGANVDILLESSVGAGGNWTIGVDGVDAGDFIISNGTGVTSNERFVIQKTSGNVGIGTTSPSYKLDSGLNAVDQIRIGRLLGGVWGGVDGSFMRIQNAALAESLGNQALRQGPNGDTQVNSASGQDLLLAIANSPKLTVHSGGNVGIGTTSPTHRLHVVGSQNLTGTLYYGALQAQSPHALIQRDSQGNLKPTSFCIVTTAGNVLEYSFNDLGVPVRLGLNTTSCMEKEILEDVEYEYGYINSTDSETGEILTEPVVLSAIEVRRKIFTNKETRTSS